MPHLSSVSPVRYGKVVTGLTARPVGVVIRTSARSRVEFGPGFDRATLGALLGGVVTVIPTAQSGMGGPAQNNEVVEGIVESVPVAMVDNLRGFKFPAEMFLHDEALGRDVTLIDVEHEVSLGGDVPTALPVWTAFSPVGRAGAGDRTVLPFSVVGPVDTSATVARAGLPERGRAWHGLCLPVSEMVTNIL